VHAGQWWMQGSAHAGAVMWQRQMPMQALQELAAGAHHSMHLLPLREAQSLPYGAH